MPILVMLISIYSAIRFCGITFSYTAIAVLLNYSAYPRPITTNVSDTALFFSTSVAAPHCRLCKRHRAEHRQFGAVLWSGPGRSGTSVDSIHSQRRAPLTRRVCTDLVDERPRAPLWLSSRIPNLQRYVPARGRAQLLHKIARFYVFAAFSFFRSFISRDIPSFLLKRGATVQTRNIYVHHTPCFIISFFSMYITSPTSSSLLFSSCFVHEPCTTARNGTVT